MGVISLLKWALTIGILLINFGSGFRADRLESRVFGLQGSGFRV